MTHMRMDITGNGFALEATPVAARPRASAS
jgi:hypothetical protein